jgi:hypothetical protein
VSVQLCKKLTGLAAAVALGATAWGQEAQQSQAQQTQPGQAQQGQAQTGQQGQAQTGQQGQAQTGQQSQAQTGQKEKKVKDQGEYDLYNAVLKEQAPAKRLELLNTWRQKYPDSDFKKERLAYLLTTYQQLGNGQKMMETVKEILAEDPKDINGLFYGNLLTISLANTAPDALDFGEKTAKSTLENLDAAFAADKKPAQVSDADWKKQRTAVEASAHNALGWVEMTRKNNDAAEQHFTQSLKVDLNQAQTSYWLGTVILAQRKPEKQSAALYHFARASAVTGQGALPAAQRQQLDAYLTKVYTNFHGSAQGLAEIKGQAAKDPFPPADFRIESSVEIATRQEEEFKKSNPMLALWMGVKKELAGPNGEQYFNDQLKGAALPKLRGKVVSMRPASRPREVMLGIADPSTPEVTLKFETPLPGPAEPGTEVFFEGVATEFTKDPFNLVVDVEREKLEGWPAPAPTKKGGAKKGTRRKR